MNEDELRSLVRDAVSRHLGGSAAAREPVPMLTHSPSRHASHGLLPVHDGGELDGHCLIEPAVMCNHCGYCQSYGH